MEFNVPLLKDVPGFQDVSTNIAGRYTKYSDFEEAAKTWKLGLNWQVVESVRFRATLSHDIRAPNLNDLYRPASVTSSSYNDRLTGGNNQGQRLSQQGNPFLTPEEAKTFTGASCSLPPSFRVSALRPTFTKRGSRMRSSMSTVEQDQFQRVCTNSAPAYDSPFCQLAIRPITDPSDPNFTNPGVQHAH